MRCVRIDRYKLIVNLAPQAVYKTHISEGAGPDGTDYWNSWLRLAEKDERAAEFVRHYRHRPAEELFDVENDPYEQNNLAGDARHATALAELRESLRRWRVEQGEDLAVVPMPEDAVRGDVPYAK
jgi:arylsulfatase A-like enzyme